MRVLGLMSGTSVDAIDAAVVDLSEGVDLSEEADVVDDPQLASRPSVRVVDHREFAWAQQLRERILAVLPPAHTTVAEVCALDQEIGHAFAEVARTICAEVADIALVACHGQTVYHWVAQGRALGSLQWGEPAWIAEATGLPVISNLRAADIAAGGQGAPLVPILDAWLFADQPTAVLNLGGIANLTVLRDGLPVVAGDTGPANCLLDAFVDHATAGRLTYDRDGAFSAPGTIDDRLLSRLLAHPYLSLPLPKSTGREVFSWDWLSGILSDGSPTPADIAATLVEFTARTVLDQLAPFAGGPTGVERLVVSGGGAHHPGIMARLGAAFQVVGPEIAGVPADAKEAVLMAVLGWLSYHRRPGVALDAHARPLTGARAPRVLGTITLA